MTGTPAIATTWSKAPAWLCLGLLTLSSACSLDDPDHSKAGSNKVESDSTQATDSQSDGRSGGGVTKDNNSDTKEDVGESSLPEGDGPDPERGGDASSSGRGESSSEGGDDTGADTSGETEDSGSSDEPKAQPKGAYVTANIDDDNNNGTQDFLEGYFPEDNDIATWELPAFKTGTRVQLKFSGAADKLHLWKDGKDWMGQGKGQVKSGFIYTSDGKPLGLQVEMGGYNAKVKMIVKPDKGDAIEFDIRASPLILNHLLQPIERAFVVSLESNRSMVQDLQSALGSKLTTVPGRKVGNDVWFQDEMEFGTMTGMNGARIDVVIESIRDRGSGGPSLGNYPKAEFTGPSGRTKDWVYEIWGRGQPIKSGDSFGNVEASPPVNVGGKNYPFGRIYHGVVNNGKLNSEMAKFLVSQEIQDPITLDTEWLCVSHVDEIMTFIPDKTAPKGFRFLFADTREGYKLLESMGASTEIGRGYREPEGFQNVGDILASRPTKDLNQRIQEDDLDPTLVKMKKELGLNDEDIILFPMLFHNVSGCRGTYRAAPLIPGTVNMLVDPGTKREKGKLIMPDPFFRRGGPQSDDPFIQYTKKVLPKDLDMIFVDDWVTYHKKNGEVHCGTNAIRTPIANWWD